MSISSFAEETAFLVEAYSRFRREYASGGGQRNLAPYGHVEFPTKTPIHLSMFREMAGEFLRELANELNRLDGYIEQLSTWSETYHSYDNQEKMCLMMEFIEPLATVAFGQPATLRARLIYCLSHTSHQANLFFVDSWDESKLPKDEAINFKNMSSCSEHWPEFENFMVAFRNLDGEGWRALTRGFRNKYHHRIPPRFEVGQTQFVTRKIGSKGQSSYSFGYCEPIPLRDFMEPLRAQHSAARACFDAYSDMLKTQWHTIDLS
jgi:hypothetical protein